MGWNLPPGCTQADIDRSLPVRTPETDPPCRGAQPCQECEDGRTHEPCQECDEDGFLVTDDGEDVECSKCDGTKRLPCEECDGTGWRTPHWCQCPDCMAD